MSMQRKLSNFSLGLILIALAAKESRSDYTFSTLVTFAPAGGGPTNPTGLTLDSQGNLYGATSGGGLNNYGTVFRISSGSEAFSSLASMPLVNNDPQGSLAVDSQGNVYGTSYGDGGSVFKVSAGTGSVSTLASLANGGVGGLSGVVVDSQGNVYSTAEQGEGIAGVFKVVAGSATATIVQSLDTRGGLTMDAQGNIYGTTYNGGTNNVGSIFKIAAGTGAFTILASFSTNGAYSPEGTLTIDSHGNLYGTTAAGTGGYPAVFEYSASTGTINTIATTQGYGGNLNSPLAVDSAGDLFGTTDDLSAGGSVFEILAGSGKLTNLHEFTTYYGSEAGVVIDSQGNIYGTTPGTLNSSGTGSGGTVFELSPSNAVPEPASLTLLGFGLMALTTTTARIRRRFQRF